MISDDEAERALDFMRDNARKAAQAKAERIYMMEYRKSVKSQIMRENDDKPLGAQEAIAYADARYLTHLKAMREAIEADEYYDWMRVSAEAKISAWQTQSRNQRANIV
jgi:hypothetical protein